MKSIAWYLPLLLFCCGCEPDPVVPTELAPLLGFGDEEGIISTEGDTLRVPVLWTRATTGPRELTFSLSGDGVGPEDLRILTPSPVTVPEGTTEIDLLFRVAEGFDTTRLERGGVVVLARNNWLRLTQRDTFTLNFGVPHTVNLRLWAPDDPFPILWGYTSFGPDPVPGGSSVTTDGEHFAFAYASLRTPNVIGMYSNSRPGASTNALNLHRIYSEYEVSSASAAIRIPELFRLIPATEGATFGTVEVIPQRVVITRRSSSGLPPFEIGISGGGTYDEVTGSISVGVIFDETALGNGAEVLRRYVYEANERP